MVTALLDSTSRHFFFFFFFFFCHEPGDRLEGGGGGRGVGTVATVDHTGEGKGLAEGKDGRRGRGVGAERGAEKGGLHHGCFLHTHTHTHTHTLCPCC